MSRREAPQSARGLCEPLEPRLCLSINFFPAIHNAVGSTVRVAAGDVTGDGKADLVAQGNDGIVRLFPGRGDGRFDTVAAGQLPTFGPVTGIAIADVNRDGNQDVLFSTGPTMLTVQAGLTVLLGHGDGTFDGPLVSWTGRDTRALAVADLNRDGKLDVVVANFGPWQMSNTDPLGYGAGLLLGRGDGTFEPVRKIPLNGSQTLVSVPVSSVNATSVASRLFDVAFGGPAVTDVTPMARIWTVKFANAPSPADSIDVDGPTVSQSFIPFIGAINGLAAGDLNRDGKLDLAALQIWNGFPSATPTNTQGDSTAYTFQIRNDGTWGAKSIVPTQTSHAAGLSLADFDRNGKLDVVVAGTDPRPLATIIPAGLLTAMAGDGTGAIGAPKLFRMVGLPTSQATADLNNDRNLDVVVSSAAGAASFVNAIDRLTAIVPTLGGDSTGNRLSSEDRLAGLMGLEMTSDLP